jgi:hypothetical protein|tara:strand:- start:44 stop:523 length:480 start_codon:yes stop_codon:yes gene_type:complete
MYDNIYKYGFRPGRFDNHLVVIFDKNNKVINNNTKDCDFLEHFKDLNLGYNDIVKVYSLASADDRCNSKNRDKDVKLIHEISKNYSDPIRCAHWLIMYYLMCIAEEANKIGRPSGKRIKLLAVHQVLKENMSPYDASQWSRGKKFKKDLLPAYKERGIE